ncbi:Hypothetical protein A7982_10160 [Minicystis rosea]|nr:Hypothetical protein A7982_10160 [Minicystis rosea]
MTRERERARSARSRSQRGSPSRSAPLASTLGLAFPPCAPIQVLPSAGRKHRAAAGKCDLTCVF